MDFFRIAGLSVLIGSVALAQPAPDTSAISPIVLQPSKPWNLNGNQSACQLAREFGTDENGLTLLLEQGSGPNYIDVWFEGSAIAKLPGQIELKLQMMPSAVTQTVTVESGTATVRKGRFVRWFNADATLLDNLQGSQQLSLTDGKSFSTAIDLRGIKSALNALRSCEVKLMQGWGVETVESRTVVVLPKPDVIAGGGNPGLVVAALFRASPGISKTELDKIVRKFREANPSRFWLTPMDYPSDALRKELSGSVTMVLSLNPEGRVDGCRIVVSSKSALLDQTSCDLLHKRAKYKPARSASGEAVRSSTVERIRWIIPPEYQ